MADISMSRVIHDLQEHYPLSEGDAGHFCFVVVRADGTFVSVHGIVTSFDQFRERIMEPATIQLEIMLENARG